jgi:serine/threonine-protein kinase
VAETDARALKILEVCLNLDEPSRRAFVAEQCGRDPAFASKIWRLLEINDSALPPTEYFGVSEEEEESLPERIGKFRVIGLIGRGGMGAVVRAERDDGLFGQVVAIKLLRSDLSGERARAHFDNERRLLARVDHPSIARILDGGEEDGRPYLVMEFVDGRPLLDDLDERKTGRAERIAAFLDVAEAVSFAHRKLVIHADLKPGNLFRSSEGRVKLLDFGVGRLIDELEEDERDPALHPLTRAYAPPERLAGEPPSIAGDVYGLGVLLREMLEEGGSGLNRDLEAIASKASHPDPAHRYPDVAALADDVRRHLMIEPVGARPNDWRYVLRRFVRRNRVGVAITAAGMALLAAAAAITFILYIDARRQREAAEMRFEEVRSLAKFQLFTLYPQLAALPGTLAARARLAEESQAYLDRLSALPEAHDAVRLETATGYNRLAEIQGVPSRANLGRVDEARRNLDRAEAILAPMVAARPDDASAAAELAWTRLFKADLAVWQDNQVAVGERLLGDAETLVARARSDSPEWRALESFRSTVRLDILGWSERYEEERVAATESLAWLATVPQSERETPAYVIATAEALSNLAEADFYTDRAQESLDAARRADGLIRAALNEHPDHPPLLSARVVTLYNLITTLEPMGLREGLLPMAQELSLLGRRSRTFEPNDRLINWRARNAEALLAQLLGAAGRHAEAVMIQEGIVAEDQRRLTAAAGDTRSARDLGFATQLLGTLQWEAGDRPAACRSWGQANELFTRLDRQGTVNDWDRTNVVAPMRHNHRICLGQLPPSAYRRPD